MKLSFFDGTEKITQSPEQQVILPASQHADRVQPENYIASSDLSNAVNVALLLGKPLLLTGEPGTGKTMLAYRVAWELGYDEPLKFETKSTSLAKDLFYHYDSLSRFHDAQFGNTGNAKWLKNTEYITYNSLGAAILRTQDESIYKEFSPENFVHGGKRRSIVLIDEIDKAPRDFPNDILNELEYLYFRVPELGGVKIEADLSLAPIVIITSNSEKSLPDAFLRRCIFHQIEFPGEAHLQSIIFSSLKTIADLSLKSNFIKDSIHLFLELRSFHHRLNKKPSTSELLLWIETMVRAFPNDFNPLMDAEREKIIAITLNTLTKMQTDREKVKGPIADWFKSKH